MTQETTQRPAGSRKFSFLGEEYFWRRALTVLALGIAVNLVIEFGLLTDLFPRLHYLQLVSHKILWGMLPRPATPKWTRLVVIDDALHEQLNEPTDRSYIATLVRNAARGDAAVIVLDFFLTVPNGYTEGSDFAERRDMNDDLRNAIFDAAKLGVPVIVPCWLDQTAHPPKVVPSIYPDQALPLAIEKNGTIECPYVACARRGNVNVAGDERQIPLKTTLQNFTQCQDSLAIATASAYDEATERQPRTREKRAIADVLKSQRYLFGSFVSEASFQTIPIRDLYAGNPEALRACRTRIVVIGGKWREALGRGPISDLHETSVGLMSGLYLQANYIEALLDDRYMKGVPALLALFLDLILGVILYLSYHKAKTVGSRYIVVSVFLLPLMAGYITFVSLGYYLDFVLPLAACFLHLGAELVFVNPAAA